MESGRNEIGMGFITEVDRYLYNNGRHYEIYEKLGAHPENYEGIDGMYFAVWAPHGSQVSVVGDFNGWDPEANPMTLLADSGIWEAFVSGLSVGELYKYAITTRSGKILFKADPYAFQSEYRPQTASVTADLSGFQWKDLTWMEKRKTKDPFNDPISVYEVHLGSWRKKNRDEKDGFYTYIEAAHELADYILEMGYTHVELMGIAEHPYDGSWGYQVTGYFAPTSRYGTPGEFMYFVNYMHKKGIGVILDWVPAHFPKDAHGLADFDGEACYEYPDPRKGEHPDWGTKVFDYSKYEVDNFLIANALYWVDKFHIDGLRVDAVASMLYLDYGRDNGEWVPNQYGGNENLEAIEFFKHLNSVIKKRGNGAMVIAEESTVWPKVTGNQEEGGLGFTFKWNMGWMHDFLEYMKLDPYFRKYNHHKMTFGLTYFTSENYILVLSHDEVVHLKCSMINKMPGLLEDKFANLKLGYTFMLGHPGKKLLFMGQDFGQFHEWDEKTALDWYLSEEPLGKSLKNYVRDLLHLYKKYPALYEKDYDWEGFYWINADDKERSIFSFIRYSKDKKRSLLFVLNFTPVARPDYRVGVPKRGTYTLLLDQDHGLYKRGEKAPSIRSEKMEWDGQEFSFPYQIPAYGAAVFRF
ncbi:1,4-alpha-glucan branching protein GlgB [Clostridium sp. WB02_MRS01]|uniref:1,4-alpha-glucan branching protein GlgB n=1 Tax=Clostridium sp. WB02_MRS01 TaxID=2605777 RepID=UPI0012B32592|nr:1,4-alpha-glucan branching protein GlgB [Clostridium sp. WB02_MRS01]MSS11406.1 1,4-alpha-glucan branching protein GlgB [Clostridium sp. WB02_MRS01]